MSGVIDIINGEWAIKPAYLEMIQSIYFERQGKSISAQELHEIEAAVGRPLNNNADRPYQVNDGVAIIPAYGSMVKRGGLLSNVSGMTSYERIQRDLQMAAEDPEVVAALLSIDSPGGVVNGCATCADAVSSFADRKPCCAWTDGMMTSAAQWLGAATGGVYIGNDTTELGSIGVIGRHVDVSKMQEMDGVKTTILTAGRYKGVGHPYAPLSAEHQGVMQDRLDYAYTAFVNAMAGYRGSKAEKVLSDMAEGRIFNGRQSIEVGLADGMMSLEDTLSMLRDQGRKKSTGSVMSFVGLPSPQGGKATAQIQQGGKRMQKEELKEQHPALYAEVFEEGKKVGEKAGEEAAVSKERERIASVLDVPAAGHSALVKQALIEGVSAESLSLNILKSEKSQRDHHLEASEKGSKALAAAEEPAAGSQEALAVIAAAVTAGSTVK